MNTLDSYKALILAYLKTGATLEPMTALQLWGCWSLSQRISELKQDGLPIKSRMTTAPSGKRHAVYWIEPSDITKLQAKYKQNAKQVQAPASETTSQVQAERQGTLKEHQAERMGNTERNTWGTANKKTPSHAN